MLHTNKNHKVFYFAGKVVQWIENTLPKLVWWIRFPFESYRRFRKQCTRNNH